MKIWVESTIKSHDFIDENYWIESQDIVRNKYIPISKTYIYKEDNIIKGFISILNNNFIGGLFVANDSQGQGIGRELVDTVKNELNSLTLNVFKENVRALKFYKREGFEIVSESIDSATLKEEILMKWKR
ncbi:N-acetyltransferase [Clostridium sardiniense]|uniref:N-acetyltransferase n=2 Tax=Clostridium sardiniense TaxID=29369 RepID=A0ABS7KW00_CLOSR|nr:N-acetyltransferase [Clostridium sardiniense]